MISTVTNSKRTRVDANLSKTIGNRVKQARKNARVTQGEMAELLGMSQPNYGVKENGNGNFAPHDILTICKLLDIDPNYLYCYDTLGLDDEDQQLVGFMKKLDHNEQVALRAFMVQTFRKNGISVPTKVRRIFMVGEQYRAS